MNVSEHFLLHPFGEIFLENYMSMLYNGWHGIRYNYYLISKIRV